MTIMEFLIADNSKNPVQLKKQQEYLTFHFSKRQNFPSSPISGWFWF
jgi:hypothetical protein